MSGLVERAAPSAAPVVAAVARPSGLARAWDSDLAYSFRRSPLVILAALVTLGFIVGAVAAPWIAPQNPFDPGQLNLMDSRMPPAWIDGGEARHALGTDDQGRDVFSAILFGSRISLIVGFAAVVLAVVLGTGLGVLAGYTGGFLDAFVMRAADVQLTIPGILVALLIDGIARVVLPREVHAQVAVTVVVVAIGLSEWPKFARVVRGVTLVEKNKDYVSAAHLIGIHPALIMLRHILPNVLGPVLVMATIGLAIAVLNEATLSFLGLGVPATTPSLGTLIRIGNNFLFSGEWWITLFPALALVLLVVAVNLVGDWLRDALNPKLR